MRYALWPFPAESPAAYAAAGAIRSQSAPASTAESTTAYASSAESPAAYAAAGAIRSQSAHASTAESTTTYAAFITTVGSQPFTS